MFSWLGFSGKSRTTNDEEAHESAPLLPDSSDADTQLQSKVYEKLHTYLMMRAVGRGYMPSTEQTIAHLRSMLGYDVFNPRNTQLTPAGRKLVRESRKLISGVIELLRKKNGDDQIQDFLYCTQRARLSLDVDDLIATAGQAKAGVDARAGYEALRTVGDLLMTNADFRKLCTDLTTIARQILSETAHTSAQVADSVAETLAPSQTELGEIDSGVPATGEEFPRETSVDGPMREVGEVIGSGVMETADAAFESAQKELAFEGHGDALLQRMKFAVLKLRGNTDYTASASILSAVVKRYGLAYSRALGETAGAVGDDLQPNAELDQAVKKLWSLVTSFGDHNEWEKLQKRWDRLLDHVRDDKQFDALMEEVGNALQDVLTDPNFAESADEKLARIRALIQGVGTDSNARDDLDALLAQAQATLRSVIEDEDVAGLMTSTRSILRVLYPTPYSLNPDIVSDLTHVLVPELLGMVQYVPILRFILATPEVDLLLENLILEPGDTVNHSSFFPHRLRVETQNDFELRKARFRYDSAITSLLTVRLHGLTVRADEVGYWMRAHSGIWRFWDEGIVSVAMDGEGLDLDIDLEIARDGGLEQLVALRAARATVHRLDYTIARSRYRWLAWPFKPVLKPILRRVLRRHVERAVADLVHFVNRELVFARERLRATRIARPRDAWTFVRAVAARLAPAEGGADVLASVGAQSRKDEPKVFEGRYAPGSIVKSWEEHGERVDEVVEVSAEGGWRNNVFDLRT